jgi:hypothetical protein
MWDFYKQVFATVQFATVTIGWTIYQASFERLGPAAVFFVSAQAAAMAASAWAGKLKKTRSPVPIADRSITAMIDSYRTR